MAMKDMDYYYGKDLPNTRVNKEDFTKRFFYRFGESLTQETVEEILGYEVTNHSVTTTDLDKNDIVMQKKVDEEGYKDAVRKAREAHNKRREEFKADLFFDNAYELGDPVAEVIYAKASEDRNFNETKDAFEDLDEFVGNILKAEKQKEALKISKRL